MNLVREFDPDLAKELAGMGINVLNSVTEIKEVAADIAHDLKEKAPEFMDMPHEDQCAKVYLIAKANCSRLNIISGELVATGMLLSAMCSAIGIQCYGIEDI